MKLSNDKVAADPKAAAKSEAATGNSKCVGFTRLRSVLLFGARTSLLVSLAVFCDGGGGGTRYTLVHNLIFALRRQKAKRKNIKSKIYRKTNFPSIKSWNLNNLSTNEHNNLFTRCNCRRATLALDRRNWITFGFLSGGLFRFLSSPSSMIFFFFLIFVCVCVFGPCGF